MGNDLSSAAGALADEALRIAEAEPARSLQLADDAAQLVDGGDRLVLGTIAWSRGLALRNLGKVRPASASLQQAVEELTQGGYAAKAASARVSLAFDHLSVGRVNEALAELDLADPDLQGVDAAQAAMQRALILQRAGRVLDSIASFDRAVKQFALLGLDGARAKALGNRGLVHTYRGDYANAEADLTVAAELFAQEGDALWASATTHNRGFVAARRGDLPKALRLFDEAQQQLTSIGAVRPEILTDRVETMLDAGLTAEARVIIESAIGAIEAAGLEVELADACDLASRACCDDGDPKAALEWAERAANLYTTQDRTRWLLHARYRGLLASVALDRSSVRPTLVEAMGKELLEAGWRQAALETDILALELAADEADFELTAKLLKRIRRSRQRASALSRLDAWVAEAYDRRARSDLRGAERALSAGFRAFDDYRDGLGSVELRARAADRTQRAAEIGLSIAAAAGDPWRALQWLERARAGLTVPRDDRGHDDDVLQALESLRQIDFQIEHQPLGPREAQRLRRHQAALEEIVRRRTRHSESLPALPTSSVDLQSLPASLGSRTLVQYGIIRNELIAVVIDGSGARLISLESLNAIRKRVSALRIALHQQALGQAEDGRLEGVAGAAKGLEDLLLGPLGADLQQLVIIPSAAVTAVPWGALPSLVASEVVVSPSATDWARRLQERPIAKLQRVLVVLGPDLLHGEEEAEAVRNVWGSSASVIRGTAATAREVLDALERSDIVHVAAHGSFRGDNPLLSAIRLSDGGLTGYDLQSIRHPPEVVVLSSCDTGMVDTESAGTFGLSGLLTGAGVRNVIASVTSVVDASSSSLMVPLHRAMLQGHSPATALAIARTSSLAGPDGFVCFGAG